MDESDRQYREGLFTSPRFWIGAGVTLAALVIGMAVMVLIRN
jgi:hypothetical protein